MPSEEHAVSPFTQQLSVDGRRESDTPTPSPYSLLCRGPRWLFISRNFQLSGARQCGERWSPDRSFSFHACSSFMQWKFNRRTSVKEIPVVLIDKLLILEGEIGH